MSDMTPIGDHERDMLSAYLDGELDPAGVQEVEAHVRQNPAWQRELDELRNTWKLLDQLPRHQVSRDFTWRTVERAQAEERRFFTFRSWHRASVRLAAAAAILVAAFIGVESVRHARYANQSSDDPLGRELLVIDSPRDDIDFLHKLANPNDSDLFGDDTTGS